MVDNTDWTMEIRRFHGGRHGRRQRRMRICLLVPIVKGSQRGLIQSRGCFLLSKHAEHETERNVGGSTEAAFEICSDLSILS